MSPSAVLAALLVDSGLVVKSLQLADAGQLAQVAVPLLVFGQQHQVPDSLFVQGGFVGNGPRGHIAFTADNGFDPGRGGLLIKIQRAEHGAVIGDGHGIHAEFLDPLKQASSRIAPSSRLYWV